MRRIVRDHGRSQRKRSHRVDIFARRENMRANPIEAHYTTFKRPLYKTSGIKRIGTQELLDARSVISRVDPNSR